MADKVEVRMLGFLHLVLEFGSSDFLLTWSYPTRSRW
jgi:hypothetical protein